MTHKELTPRQREVYDFIRGKVRERGYPPTVREIGAHMGIKNPNGVVCHLKALRAKGVIATDPRTARGIRLTPPAPRRGFSLPILRV
ncbi:MAG TPA: hypothetical protein VEI97_05515 [bacterium]|nr:hypothetical protein [bacterium]